MAIQIGKYKRPGIFVEEFDNSVITAPTVDGIATMVIGFSKKGPVNAPVLLTNLNDMEKIFGSIDRNLEKKGSFFHRTVSKMLESSPVYAINLLLTNDELDKIEYKSLSTSAKFNNDVAREGAYRKFFDTTGFWKRDTEAFINLVNLDANTVGDSDRLLNFTNLGDKYITVFIFKSKVAGFDRTLIEWYGSTDKLPSYLNQQDWASDYMVDVIVVGGNYSDYANLSIDTRWSQYFSDKGLKKDQIYNFANDRNINLLGFYEGLSLIPYFRDSNGRNIFIENVINTDTNKTGLFCAFNADLFETDVQNNKIDLTGSSLVGASATTINFLSYNETIVEDITYNNVYLDRTGNVSAFGAATTLQNPDDDNRTSIYREGYVNDLTGTFAGTTALSIDFSIGGSTNSYAIISETKIDISTDTNFTFNGGTVTYPESIGVTTSYKYVYKLDVDGNIEQAGGNLTNYPTVDATDLVLGKLSFDVFNGTISNATYSNVTVNSVGFVDLPFNGSFGYTISNVGTTSSADIKIEFLNTNTTANTANYEAYRSIKLFNYLLDVVDSPSSVKASMLINSTTMEKRSLLTMDVVDVVTATSQNKSLTIKTGLPESDLTDVLNGNLVFYKLDNEFILGSDNISTKDTVMMGASYGVVSRWSDFYQNFEQGLINTGDFFLDVNNSNAEVHLNMNITNNVLTVNYVDAVGAVYQMFTNPTTVTVSSNDSNFKQTVEIETPVGYTQVANKILINASRYTEVKIGDYLESDWEAGWTASADYDPDREPRRAVRILSKKLYAGDTTLVEITTDGGIKKNNVNGDLQATRYTKIDDYASTYTGITFKGFRIREASMPDGTEDRQNAILNLVSKGTPMFKAITNKEALDFRYLIDSFGLGLTERSKQQLVDICGQRLDVFGFLNMPSLKSFKRSTSPSFVNNEGVLQVEFIAKGGDPESSPAFLYSFGEGRGTTTVGYFLPYLTVNDNGRPFDVPPAMFAATTYMRKLNSNVTTITPWTIAAGVTNGKVTGIAGVEEQFTPEDIEFLNQAQMNPIVFKRNRGYVIETENTAQTLYKSSLSYIHSREVLIELERELSRMLLDFQWKFNTPEIRAEIKLRADVICEKYVNKNGLYTYFNKCDEENNTPDIIDNQVGVLDTYVEIVKGMSVIVNNVTILRTGSIQSGGFNLL